MDLIIFYVAYILSRFFSGNEDGGVSLSEIELAQSRGRSKDPKNLIIQNKLRDKERRDKWHRDGGYKLTFISIALSGFYYPNIYCMLAMPLSVLCLQVMIFNPIIATKYLKQNFFYISNSGVDGIFKRTIGEKIYYFGAWAVFVACLGVLIAFKYNILNY